jgi:hypothetical protein
MHSTSLHTNAASRLVIVPFFIVCDRSPRTRVSAKRSAASLSKGGLIRYQGFGNLAGKVTHRFTDSGDLPVSPTHYRAGLEAHDVASKTRHLGTREMGHVLVWVLLAKANRKHSSDPT